MPVQGQRQRWEGSLAAVKKLRGAAPAGTSVGQFWAVRGRGAHPLDEATALVGPARRLIKLS